MKIRHVIDESGFWLDGLAGERIIEEIESFLERLDHARDRAEQVARTASDLYDAPVTKRLRLFQLMFDDDLSPLDDIDLRRRLRVAIDRAQIWDDNDDLFSLVSALEVTIDGTLIFAPSIAFAHACRRRPRAIGCMGLRTSGRAGVVDVSVEQEVHALHFIVDEQTHVGLFRGAVEIEDMNEAAFAENSGSAFPRLLWADELWPGLGRFERPYREHRPALVRHLGVLNDHAARLFAEFMASRPEEVGPRLDALGVEASDENGRTKQDKRAQRDRARQFQGREIVFWWHTKLLRHVDRIHFIWQPGPQGSAGDIVIGLFTDHCHVPD